MPGFSISQSNPGSNAIIAGAVLAAIAASISAKAARVVTLIIGNWNRFSPALVLGVFVALPSAFLLCFSVPAWAENEAATSGHHLFVDKDGKLWGWGDNASGQLGMGALSATNLPLPVSMAAPILSAVAGRRHSVAVDKLGTVWVWGDNSAGQLGTGNFKSSAKPLRLELPPMLAVSAGVWHTAALDKTGHVWAWGGNTLGQLGDGKSGKFSVSATPQKINGLENIIAIRSGNYHVLVLRGDGTVWAWGGNQEGQLGNGKQVPHDRPSQVAGLEKIHLIGVGGNASQAVGTDGKAWAWGKVPGENEGWLTPRQFANTLPDKVAAAFSISGRVIANGHPVAGAAVLVGAEICGQTDSHGSYRCLLPAGFEGELQARKEDFIFAAAKISPISKALTGQNIRGSANAVKPRQKLISEPEENRVAERANPISLPLVNSFSVSTPPVNSLPASNPPASTSPASLPHMDSSERIREKETIRSVVTAVPEPRATVVEDMPAPKKSEQQAVNMRISGTIHLSGTNTKDQPVTGVEIAGNGAQCSQTDGRGEYSCSVPAGWSGRIVVAKRNYRFSPTAISFRDIRDDRSYQDFTAVYDPN